MKEIKDFRLIKQKIMFDLKQQQQVKEKVKIYIDLTRFCN